MSAQRGGSTRKCVDLLCGDRRLCINHLPGLGRNDLLIIIAEHVSEKTFSVLSPKASNICEAFGATTEKENYVDLGVENETNLLKSHKVDIFSFY